ncbi:hypothetical protein LX32DRAFT_355532 [Colletotrichum zoysiae]|uniref:Uncharacterized protein n=1 Tax=Colletotrichum zoysiae TaxID=1216348 RepID=A0AAD9HK50_9PEZI|nr:hypothetical protein LX32DRAFT_355532 [Colletotrichum zoysiae]
MLKGRPVPSHAVLGLSQSATSRRNVSLWNSWFGLFFLLLSFTSSALALPSPPPSLLMPLLNVGPTRNADPKFNDQWFRKCNPPIVNRTEPYTHGFLASSSGPCPAGNGETFNSSQPDCPGLPLQHSTE